MGLLLPASPAPGLTARALLGTGKLASSLGKSPPQYEAGEGQRGAVPRKGACCTPGPAATPKHPRLPPKLKLARPGYSFLESSNYLTW